jgi:hypothetical protein
LSDPGKLTARAHLALSLLVNLDNVMSPPANGDIKGRAGLVEQAARAAMLNSSIGYALALLWVDEGEIAADAMRLRERMAETGKQIDAFNKSVSWWHKIALEEWRRRKAAPSSMTNAAIYRAIGKVVRKAAAPNQPIPGGLEGAIKKMLSRKSSGTAVR